MILKILNFCKGYIKISVKGAYLERFFNICAHNEIALWDIKRRDIDYVELCLHNADYKRLLCIIDRTKCSTKIIDKKGVPFLMFNMRKRYAFVGGFALLCVVLHVLTSYLFAINISGTDNTALVYKALKENDIKIGTKLSSIDAVFTQNEIIRDFDEFLWIAINLKGNMANIEVLEREDMPDIIDKNTPCDIIADKSGIVDSIDVLSGEKMVISGQTFTAGDVLVSSEIIGLPQFEDPEIRLVHSIADVRATVWYDTDRVLQREIYSKKYTGRSQNKVSIIFGKKAINLYKNTSISYPFYDKIVSIEKFELSDSVTVPVYIKTEKYIEYEPEIVLIDPETAGEIMSANTKKSLYNHIIGDIIDTSFNTEFDEKTVTLTSNIQTLEKVGISVPR